MSSGGGKTTTVQSEGAPKWAIPYFQSAFSQASNVANQPYTQYGGPRLADFTQDQQAGFNEARHQAGKNYEMSGTGDKYVSDILGGNGAFRAQQNPYQGASNPYATENSYLDQMVQDSQGDVTKAYQNSTLPNLLGQFNAGGAYGGTAMQQALSQSNQDLAGQLGRVSTNLRGADFDRRAQLAESGLNRDAQLADSYLGRQQSAWGQDMSNRQAALGMIPSLAQSRFSGAQALGNIGQQQQNLYQGAIDTDYNDWKEYRDWDANRLGLLTSALGSLNGGAGTTTQGPNPNYRSAGENVASYATILAGLWGQ